MSKQYDLTNYGIETPVDLIGSLTFLKFKMGLPTVFLFDEHHGNLNSCIYKNIANAIELIDKGHVILVGVESLAGGKSWDYQNQVYSEVYSEKKLDDVFVKSYKSGVTKFSDEVAKSLKNGIRGVECFGMIHIIMEDITLGKYQEVKSHPLNIERSKHFIQTLFESQKVNNGNLILNCGSEHNTHIVNWINNDEIDGITGCEANYIRINTIQ